MKIKPKLKIGARDINDNFCNDCKFKIKKKKGKFCLLFDKILELYDPVYLYLRCRKCMKQKELK